MQSSPVVLIGETTTGVPLTISGRMFFMPQESPPGQADKRQFEYMNFYAPYSAHHPDFIAKMNELGADGWLLVTVSGSYLFFVREIK